MESPKGSEPANERNKKMASVEFITKRIEGKEKELEKLTKKLERIRKAEATGWTVNPYYYHESDLKYTLRDIEAAQKALDGSRQSQCSCLQPPMAKGRTRDYGRVSRC